MQRRIKLLKTFDAMYNCKSIATALWACYQNGILFEVLQVDHCLLFENIEQVLKVRKRNRKFYMEIMVFGDNQCSNSPIFQWSTMS